MLVMHYFLRSDVDSSSSSSFNHSNMIDFNDIDNDEPKTGSSDDDQTSILSLGNQSLLDDDEYEYVGVGIEFHRVMSILNTYVLPVIILIGIVGNTVSFLVYVATPRLCRQSSSLYLAFLAMVDNISLVSIFVVWFGWVGIHIFHKNGWCQTIHYCTYVCSFLSAWTVVSFTCERWIVVFHPLKRHQLCTRKRAMAVMTSLTLTSLVFYSFSLFTTSVHHHNGMQVCIERTKNPLPLQVIRTVDTILIVVVPLFSIFIMNAAIGIKICHYTGRRKGKNSPLDSSAADHEIFSNYSTLQKGTLDIRHLSSGAKPSQTAVNNLLSTTALGVVGGSRTWRVLTRKQHTQVRITRALLIVSTVFIVLNLPSYAFRIHAFVISIRKESLPPSIQAYIWQEFIQFVYYSNFSSRFFLYSACSRNFRCALCRFVCRRKQER